MNPSESTTRAADNLLENHKFEEARDAYRKALLEESEEPKEEVLFNLGIAEDGERILFLRALQKRFPSHVSTFLYEAQLLLTMSDHSQSVAICNKILSFDVLSPSDRARAHLIRLSAATRSANAEAFIQSFCYLWNYISDEKQRLVLRRKLCVRLISTTNPCFIEELINFAIPNSNDSEILEKLIRLKINKLKIISQIIQ